MNQSGLFRIFRKAKLGSGKCAGRRIQATLVFSVLLLGLLPRAPVYLKKTNRWPSATVIPSRQFETSRSLRPSVLPCQSLRPALRLSRPATASPSRVVRAAGSEKRRAVGSKTVSLPRAHHARPRHVSIVRAADRTVQVAGGPGSSLRDRLDWHCMK
jgi:hypothetical protein